MDQPSSTFTDPSSIKMPVLPCQIISTWQVLPCLRREILVKILHTHIFLQDKGNRTKRLIVVSAFWLKEPVFPGEWLEVCRAVQVVRVVLDKLSQTLGSQTQGTPFNASSRWEAFLQRALVSIPPDRACHNLNLCSVSWSRPQCSQGGDSGVSVTPLPN